MCDQAVEDRLPVLVAGEVVVGDEEVVTPWARLARTSRSTSSASRAARLAALDVDDRAEAALERAAAAGVEARAHAGRPAHDLRRQERRRHALQVGQVVHEVVERLAARPRYGGLQQLLHPPFRLAGEERDRRDPSRRASSGGSSGSIARQPLTWNPPMPTWMPAARERPRDVDGARELVGLHADEADEPASARRAGSAG